MAASRQGSTSYWREALLPFGYLMVLVAIGTILRSLRDVLFLDRIGYESLPSVFLATTVISIVAASGYIRLARQKSPVWVACFSFALFAVAFLAIYWWLSNVNWLHYVFYVLVALFNTFTVLQFWALVNHYWDPDTLEREIPFIGSGGLFGGILGGFLVAWLAGSGPETSLWCALALTVPLILLGCGIGRQKAIGSRRDLKSSPVFGNLLNYLSSVRSNRYYCFLAGLTFVSAVAIILADFQFKQAVALRIADRSEMARLFGIFFAASSVGALLVQWVVLPGLLRQLKPHNLNLFLPGSFLVFSGWLLFSPALFSALMLKGSEGIFRHTVDRAGMELFYSPIRRDQQYPLKIAIEGTLARAGEVVGALVLLVLIASPGFGYRSAALALVVATSVWLAIAWKMKDAYSNYLLQWLSEFASTLSPAARDRIQQEMYTFSKEDQPSSQIDDRSCDRIVAETGISCRPEWCEEFRIVAQTYPPDVVIPCYWGWISAQPTARRFAQVVLRRLGTYPLPG